MQEVHTILPVGSILQNRYGIEALLGQGGFGAVYLVRDQRVRGNLFALKEVLGPDKEARRRFLFEADVLKKHDHPSLPRVYRVFEDEIQQRAYMLMDYIEGPNLEQLRLQQPGERLSLQQMEAVLAPIIDVLTYLHTLHPPIIHRDLKPANIIVPLSSEDAVLVDFGIAKVYDEDGTTTAVRHASPGYGAPEQYGRGTNIATDIYGLGATCYALLSGVVPVDALTRMTHVGDKEKDPLVPLETLVPGVPPHVAAAIHQALALNSRMRFPSVAQFWNAVSNHAARAASGPSEKGTLFAQAPHGGHLSVIANEVHTAALQSAQGGSAAKPISSRPAKRKRLLLLLLALLIVSAAGGSLFWFMPLHYMGISSVPQNKLLLTPTSNAVTVVAQNGSTGTAVPRMTPVSSLPTKGATTGPSIPPVVGTGATPGATATAPVPQPTATSVPAPTPTPPTPVPTPTPAPAAYPHLVSSYSGVVDDTTARPDIKVSMFLSSIQQNQGSISGYFIVNQPLVGSNNFTGTVTKNHRIQFIVASYNGNAPLFFSGTIASNGNMSGSYCSIDASGRCNANVGAAGVWSVCPCASNAIPASIRLSLWRFQP